MTDRRADNAARARALIAEMQANQAKADASRRSAGVPSPEPETPQQTLDRIKALPPAKLSDHLAAQFRRDPAREAAE